MTKFVRGKNILVGHLNHCEKGNEKVRLLQANRTSWILISFKYERPFVGDDNTDFAEHRIKETRPCRVSSNVFQYDQDRAKTVPSIGVRWELT